MELNPPRANGTEDEIDLKDPAFSICSAGCSGTVVFGDGKLQVFVLGEEQYVEVETSPTFGKLPVIEGILQFLKLSETEGSSAARRAVRQWVREALAIL